jgi:hypothetical protein
VNDLPDAVRIRYNECYIFIRIKQSIERNFCSSRRVRRGHFLKPRNLIFSGLRSSTFQEAILCDFFTIPRINYFTVVHNYQSNVHAIIDMSQCPLGSILMRGSHKEILPKYIILKNRGMRRIILHATTIARTNKASVRHLDFDPGSLCPRLVINARYRKPGLLQALYYHFRDNTKTASQREVRLAYVYGELSKASHYILTHPTID